MARRDGEDWLEGGAIQLGGGAPEAPEEERDYLGLGTAVVIGVAAGVASGMRPYTDALVVAASIGILARAGEWLVRPLFGRRRWTSGGRIAYGCLIATIGLLGTLLLDGAAQTGAWVVAGVLLAALYVADAFHGDPADGD